MKISESELKQILKEEIYKELYRRQALEEGAIKDWFKRKWNGIKSIKNPTDMNDDVVYDRFDRNKSRLRGFAKSLGVVLMSLAYTKKLNVVDQANYEIKQGIEDLYTMMYGNTNANHRPSTNHNNSITKKLQDLYGRERGDLSTNPSAYSERDKQGAIRLLKYYVRKIQKDGGQSDNVEKLLQFIVQNA